MSKENKIIIPANNFFSEATIKTDLIIVADNLKTPENMGAVIRLAGNFGAKKVVFINKETINIKKINRFSASVSNLIETHFVDDINDIKTFVDDSYKFIALDTEKNAKSILNYKFRKNIALVIGNEKYGISDDLLSVISESLFIPMNGQVKSMNVTHALSIAIYEYTKQNL